MSRRAAAAGPRLSGPALGVAVVLLATACAGLKPYPKVEMLEEDSHPHEVRPGTETRFHISAVRKSARLDVKCTLSGPAGPIELRFHGIRPEGWAALNPRFDVGSREILVDIEGVVEPGHATPFFAFANGDPRRLLWHQCYNN